MHPRTERTFSLTPRFSRVIGASRAFTTVSTVSQPARSPRDFPEMKFRTLNPGPAPSQNSVRSDLFVARANQPEHISLSSSGGEGRGEEAIFSHEGGSWRGGPFLAPGLATRFVFIRPAVRDSWFPSPRKSVSIRTAILKILVFLTRFDFRRFRAAPGRSLRFHFSVPIFLSEIFSVSLIRVHQCSSVVKSVLVAAVPRWVHPWFQE